MDARRVEPEEIMNKCGWCGRTIRDGEPVFAVGGKKRPGIDTSDYEGAGIKLDMVTQDRDIVLIIPPPDSDARQDGYDFMCMLCSEDCGNEIKKALEAEAEMGNALFGEIDDMDI